MHFEVRHFLHALSILWIILHKKYIRYLYYHHVNHVGQFEHPVKLVQILAKLSHISDIYSTVKFFCLHWRKNKRSGFDITSQMFPRQLTVLGIGGSKLTSVKHLLLKLFLICKKILIFFYLIGP